MQYFRLSFPAVKQDSKEFKLALKKAGPKYGLRPFLTQLFWATDRLAQYKLWPDKYFFKYKFWPFCEKGLALIDAQSFSNYFEVGTWGCEKI
jgi:hypothetical protein